MTSSQRNPLPGLLVSFVLLVPVTAPAQFDSVQLKCHETISKFGAKLADHQLTQARLADMALQIDAAALLVYRAAWTKDRGAKRVTREAAMAKMFATEAAQRVIRNGRIGRWVVACGRSVLRDGTFVILLAARG